MTWANLPRELKERAQWCIAAPAGMFSEKGKEPLTLRSDGTFTFASVVEPGTWMSFDEAAHIASLQGFHIGYVLTSDDPYSCIDFDIKDASNAPGKENLWTTREEYEYYLDSIRRFDTYTEYSASGKGFHVWARGKIGRGVRGYGVEIYSQERFIISTGVVTNNKPIEFREAQLLSFADQIRPRSSANEIILENLPPEDDDWFILQTAFNAENSEKFIALWKGKWEELGYPSQSEADLALLSMLTFYSKSNRQVINLFRDSSLGQRDKATRNTDYLIRTIKKIRAREVAEQSTQIGIVLESDKFRSELKAVQEQIAILQGATNPVEVHPLHVAGLAVPQQHIPNTAAAMASNAPLPATVVAASEEGAPWPPGIAGKIAQFVYQSAPRPVKEVAIVASLGLLAGVCGKAWHLPQSGLNMYITLIAQSGVGKEAMHSGISAIVKAVTQVDPTFHNFVNFDSFASGPALTKGAAMNPSFVNISGEWGKTLKRMAEATGGKDPSISSLRQVMTNLYQKSGPQSIVGGIRYSQADNNIASVSGVAYSMIGETTPGTFFEALTEDMMEDGFLSRFLSVEYTGIRKQANENQLMIPDSALIEVLANLGNAANRVVTGTSPSIPIGRTEDAATIMANFEKECDSEINKSNNESYRQMWNRAALKAMRVAGLLAVADHHLYPCITAPQIEWAIDLVRRDIGIMKRRIEIGDVGVTDKSRERKLAMIISNYLNKPTPKSHQEAERLKAGNVVSRRYIQVYCGQSAAFSKFRGGAVQGMDLAIKSFIDNGFLAEVPKEKAHKVYAYHGKCYQILNLPGVGSIDDE